MTFANRVDRSRWLSAEEISRRKRKQSMADQSHSCTYLIISTGQLFFRRMRGRHDQRWESPVGHLARVFARHRGGSFHPTSKLARHCSRISDGRAGANRTCSARPPVAQHGDEGARGGGGRRRRRWEVYGSYMGRHVDRIGRGFARRSTRRRRRRAEGKNECEK